MEHEIVKGSMKSHTVPKILPVEYPWIRWKNTIVVSGLKGSGGGKDDGDFFRRSFFDYSGDLPGIGHGQEDKDYPPTTACD